MGNTENCLTDYSIQNVKSNMVEFPKLKVLYSTPSVSRLFTGVYEVERNIALHLTTFGVEVEIHGIIDAYTHEDLPNWMPLKPNLYKPLIPKLLDYNQKYLNNLLNSNAHVGHIHSLWSYTSYALYKWAKIKKKPYLFTVNGYLDKWALNNSRLKKQLAFNLGFKKVITNASCIQVNTMAEYNAVRELGFKNPICVISNGVNFPKMQHKTNPPWIVDSNTIGKKILLYLSRIHPKKGIDILVDAWDILSDRKQLEDWHLVIVGFNSKETTSFEQQIRQKVLNKKSQDSITLLDGQYDEMMDACYYYSSGFILPSFSEGASIAALNALAFSKPAIITPGCNLDEPFNIGAALKIEPNIESVTDGILSLIKMSEIEKNNMGNNGRKLVEDKYSWKSVSLKILDIYNWIIDNNNPYNIPPTVIVD